MSSSLPRADAAVDNGSAASSTSKHRDGGGRDAALATVTPATDFDTDTDTAAAVHASSIPSDVNMMGSSAPSASQSHPQPSSRNTPSRKTSTHTTAPSRNERSQLLPVESTAALSSTHATASNIITRNNRKSRTSSPSSSLSPRAQAYSSLPVASTVDSPQPPRIPAASGYGTRSRNRAANAPRPNYAEDPDLDPDFGLISPPQRRASAATTAARNGSSSGNAASAAANDSNSGGGGGGAITSTSNSTTTRPYTSRRSGANATSTSGDKPEKSGRGNRSYNTGTAARSRDRDVKGEKPVAHASLNGSTATSTSNNNVNSAMANGSTPASTATMPSTAGRKRKHPAVPNNTVGNAKDPSPSSVKRVFIAPADISKKPGASFSARNMMSFENSRACLKNGKLKADDGTVLAPNGSSHATLHTRYSACFLHVFLILLANCHGLIRSCVFDM